MDCAGWSLFLFYKFNDNWIRRLCPRQLLYLQHFWDRGWGESSFWYHGSEYVFDIIQEEGIAKLIFGSIYLLLGTAIIAMCFNLLQEKISTQVRYKMVDKSFSSLLTSPYLVSLLWTGPWLSQTIWKWRYLVSIKF